MKRPERLLVLAILVACCGLLPARSAPSMQAMPSIGRPVPGRPIPQQVTSNGPEWPLTDAERLERTTHAADAIVAGRLVALVDTAVSRDGKLFYSHHLRFDPALWIRGGEGTARLWVAVPNGANALAARGRLQLPVVLFLARLAPGDPLATAPDIRWVLLDSETDYMHGAAPFSAANWDSLAAAIDEASNARSLDALTRRADAIVVAKPTIVASKDPEAVGTLVHVSRWIKNSDRTSDIRVAAPFPGEMPKGEALLFLQRVGGAQFHLLSAPAGGMPIQGGRVVPLDAPLDSVVTWVQRTMRR